MYEDFENNNPKWMKLVDLYNERWKEKWGDNEGCFTYEMRFDTVHLISKQMGFIKWLVENDKIDRGKIEEGISGDVSLYLDNREYYGRYKWLLMLLSISDTPLNDLFQLLK